MHSLGVLGGVLHSVSMPRPGDTAFAVQWSCMGSSGSRECDTGWRKVLEWPLDLTIWHCGLTVVDTASILPIIYACISLHFHIWELMFYKVEDVEEGMVREQEL